MADFAAFLGELTGFLLAELGFRLGNLFSGLFQSFITSGLSLLGGVLVVGADCFFGLSGVLSGLARRVGGLGSGVGGQLLGVGGFLTSLLFRVGVRSTGRLSSFGFVGLGLGDLLGFG